MEATRGAYDDLYTYTMGRDGASFILQHVVDAYAGQTASESTKPISVAFALVGLYLRVERRFSGRQIQQVHAQLARKGQQWPAIPLPCDRGRTTAADVLAAPAGAERDMALDVWCQSVWARYQESRPTIVELLRECHIT